MAERFWTKSYDAGITDLDPESWETTYVEAVKQIFKEFPNKAALAYMGVEVTYGDLDRYANRFADMLIKNGLKKGDVVGINLPNIPEYVIAWLGTLRAGCVVSGVSPLLSAEEMEYQLSDVNAKALVTLDAIFAGRLVGISSNLPDLKLVATASVGGFLPWIKRFLGKLLKKIPTGQVTPLPGKTVVDMKEVIGDPKYSAEHPTVEITPDDIAYIQYTGGTTGSPKGAMLTHRNAVSDLLLVQDWLGWEKGKGVALSGFPFFHVAGLFFNENCIYLGWTQVLIPNPRDTDHICKELAKYRPTALVNVPSLFQMLIANPKFMELDHSNIEVCVTAAAPFPEESQKQLESVVGKGKLMEVYGMTETSPLTAMNPYRGVKKLGSIGLPLPNTDIRLIDPDTGREAALGEPGEICVKGPMVMPGYYNKPEETALVFDSEGYLHTGDVAVQDPEGYLRIVDRTKDMIIVSGFKVFSKKVEEVLAEHPAVDMVALIGVPNPERPGSELVKALVTPVPGNKFQGDDEGLKADIMKMAKDKLTPYEVPKTIEIRQELPLTAVGKVDKKVLRKE
ncbi:MAG: AMP-binding protein [Actinobacteria bacterium]|nr:AMP-binding protein [Actinomycetota bacterium]MBU1944323.1 AMP-binding protein [Actinomycetota bacterium]MBU2688308.1 AMP-binding protein [Actinomycetota bacterium]